MNKTLSLAGIEGAVFDIDGTMINNNDYHKEAFSIFAKRHNLPFGLDDFQKRISGRTNPKIMRDFFGEDLTAEHAAAYADEKEAIYRELYEPFITEVEGLRSLIIQLKERGIRLAIATSAPQANRKLILDALDLHQFFETVIGIEHISEGKPHPEAYLKAMEGLGVSPKNCIIFEDSPPGVEAAVRSGARTVVGILSGHTAEELTHASMLVEHFNQLELVD